jgi:hypothetical protein
MVGLVLTAVCLTLAVAEQALAQEVLVARRGMRMNGAAFVVPPSPDQLIDSRVTYSNINETDSIVVAAIRIFRPDGTEETSVAFPFGLPLTLAPHESTGFNFSGLGVSPTTFAETGGFLVKTEWQSASGRRAIGLQSATTIFVLNSVTLELKDQEVVNGVDLPR